MALAVPLPDPDEITTEAMIATPELELLKACIANIIDLQTRLDVLEP